MGKFMKMHLRTSSLILGLIFLSSFLPIQDSEEKELEKSELKALKQNIIGKRYYHDFAHKKGFDKSEITYLGIARDNNKKQYKILTSYFVYSTSSDMCHGTSCIKIYNLKNEFIGQYYVGAYVSLPDALKDNKLIYTKNTEQCPIRKNGIIDLSKGLPKEFFIPCTKGGGDIYTFRKGK